MRCPSPIIGKTAYVDSNRRIALAFEPALKHQMPEDSMRDRTGQRYDFRGTVYAHAARRDRDAVARALLSATTQIRPPAP